MSRTTKDIKQLQKLSKTDLIVLLCELEEELERFEASNKSLEAQNRAFANQNRELADQNQGLAGQNRELADQNRELAKQIQLANSRLLEARSERKEWDDVKAFMRQISRMNEQMRAQLAALQKMGEAQGRKPEPARREAEAIIEETRSRAEEITRNLRETSMAMIDNMQQAIGHACEETKPSNGGELYTKGLADGREKEVPRNSGPIAGEAERDPGDIVINAEQAKKLLNILRRIKRAQGIG